MTAVDEKHPETQGCKSSSFLKSLTLFTGFTDDEMNVFIDTAHIKSYKKGEPLYLDGEKAGYFYIICSGWVKLSRSTEEGEEIILAMLSGSSITGENALFEDGRYTSSAQVAEEAQILSLPLSLLKQELLTNSRLGFNMLTSMVQYKRQHELHLEQYLLYSAPQRIGCFLLGLCPALEQKDGVVLNLPYDKTLIASTLGMKSATFSRALNILRKETGIDISGTRVTIASMKSLLDFVNGCYAYPNQNRG